MEREKAKRIECSAEHNHGHKSRASSPFPDLIPPQFFSPCNDGSEIGKQNRHHLVLLLRREEKIMRGVVVLTDLNELEGQSSPGQ